MSLKIKKYLFLFLFVFAQPSILRAEIEYKTPLDYLTAMVLAHKTSTYELIYVMQQDDNWESFRLRHTFINDKEYAQLLSLDHNREEIILNNQIVSYLGHHFRPFSLNSPHILDNLPNVLYTNYASLDGYTFLDSGKDCISDCLARIIHLIPNDKLRYSYTLWIDEETKLLLKSQLYSENQTVLEEFRVLQLYQSEELKMIANVIEALMLPALVSTQEKSIESSSNWDTDWLPTGFQLVNNYIMSGNIYLAEKENIESRLYSDGLSMLTVYIMPSQGVNFNEYSWKQGKLTILNQTVNDKDIIIIGEIPIQSAKKVLQNIHFMGDRVQ